MTDRQPVVAFAFALACLLIGCVSESDTDDLSTTASALHCTRTPLPSGAGQSWNWGGGHGYPDIVVPTSPACSGATITSITIFDWDPAAALVAAVNENPATDRIIYIDGRLDIDLTGEMLVLGEGIWLASDRGRIRSDGTSSPGAVLRSTGDHGFITVAGDDVRITGLRIWGDETAYCDPGPDRDNPLCGDDPPAIAVDGLDFTGDRLEVDNCDIGGWGYAGVEVWAALDANVHHNYIHHVQREGLGYPVVVAGKWGNGDENYPSSAVIGHNRFQYYRHAIASQGAVGHSYTAHDNLAMDQAIGRVFDVHQQNEDDDTGPAGNLMLVYNNIFLPDYFYSFDVRGEPNEGAYFYSNCTTRVRAPGGEPQSDCEGAGQLPGDPNDGTVCQRHQGEENVWVDYDENLVYRPNRYAQTPAACATMRWCMSSGGRSPYRYLASSTYGLTDGMAFGDFDGNGVTDVFLHTGSTWRVSFDGINPWVTVLTNSTPFADLRFGDFCGDQKTDVFRSLVVPGESSTWQCIPGEAASGGTWGPWQNLQSDFGVTYPATNLAVGYFDPLDTGPNKKADIFRSSGTTWQYRKNGTGPWYTLTTSAPSTGLSGLAFHDFAGDTRTDVFHATGSEWRRYTSGLGSGTTISPANNLALNKLDFGDFDVDGKTDVLYANGRQWRYMSAGTGNWIQLAVAAEFYSEVAVGNFDGDPTRADVFFPGCQ